LLCRPQIENKELRDLLDISKGSVKILREENDQPPKAATEWEQSPQPGSNE